MFYEFSVKWARRSMTGYYNGTKTVAINADSYDEALDNISGKARREVARDGAFQANEIEIDEVVLIS